MKRKLFIIASLLLLFQCGAAFGETAKSPDGRMEVSVYAKDGKAFYDVKYDGIEMVSPSRLGLVLDFGDLTTGLTEKASRTSEVDERYTLTRSKTAQARYHARLMEVDFENAGGLKMTVEVSVGNNDIGLRYRLPVQKDRRAVRVVSEATSYNFPGGTTTFLCPKSEPMTGWSRCQPSYEEDYTPDAPMTAKSKYGQGYTLPCLFRAGQNGWILLSETGVGSNYCGSHLSDYQPGRGYTQAYPSQAENNGFGTADAALSLPGETPWRTLVVGKTLQPIAETTVQFDLVKPLYAPTRNYKPGRYVWSWLLWQDDSMNPDDQKAFVDLAATMGYEYVLVDALWDSRLGRDGLERLARYAGSKGVGLFVWYNSNGTWNDAPQGPRNCFNTAVGREREMAWLQKAGIKGVKVDFFAGDKQETLRLYEDILSDANRHGLQVIFHGCTIPRGWERMFPNYVASEAVLASENLYFAQRHCDAEGFELTMHPFCRNAIGSMDFGGTVMNKRMSRDNNSNHYRRTGDVFEMACAITVQTSVNCISLYPNNLKELPQFELDFLRSVPTTWEESRLIDGYPGRYVVMARKHEGRWYVGGLNGEKAARRLDLALPMLAGKTVTMYIDRKARKGQLPSAWKTTLKVGADGKASVTLQPDGGMILVEEK